MNKIIKESQIKQFKDGVGAHLIPNNRYIKQTTF